MSVPVTATVYNIYTTEIPPAVIKTLNANIVLYDQDCVQETIEILDEDGNPLDGKRLTQTISRDSTTEATDLI